MNIHLKTSLFAAAAVLSLAACSSSAKPSAGAGAGGTSGGAPTSAASSSTAAGSSAGSSSGKAVKILWVQPLFTHPVHKIMQAGFKAACAQDHYSCTLVGNPSASNYDIPATVALAEAARARCRT